MRRNQDWLRLFVSKKESSGTRMKLIVGLGNPGREYELTRHNIGFMAIDELAKRWNISLNEQKFKGVFGAGFVNGEKVILLKPLTYMNESGSAISQAVKFYKLQPEDILILHDDMDIPVGSLRIRKNGSGGGQKGMKSIINALGTDQIARVRIGVGHSEPGNHAKVPDWVLSPVPKAEREEFERIISIAADAAAAWVNEPLDKVMNKYNIKEKKK